MRDEEALDGAVEYDDLDPIIGLERGDDLIQLRNALRAEDVEGWVVESNTPIERLASLKTDALRLFWTVHCYLPGVSVEPAAPQDPADRTKRRASSLGDQTERAHVRAANVAGQRDRPPIRFQCRSINPLSASAI